jgi:hypothetical protein
LINFLRWVGWTQVARGRVLVGSTATSNWSL